MYVIHDTMHCKPGKVRDMVERFKKMNAYAPKMGLKPSRILTDISGEPFWTIVAITEVERLDDFFAAMEKGANIPELGPIMAGYHDLVVSGDRKIYKLEA